MEEGKGEKEGNLRKKGYERKRGVKEGRRINEVQREKRNGTGRTEGGSADKKRRFLLKILFNV